MASPVRIGILHSFKGPMAMDCPFLKDAALLAVREINERGGVLGRQVEVLLGDGESRPEVYQKEAARLVAEERVCSLFGCWTSSSRKAVKSVVENDNSLLWYPIQYEGLEQSEHIVYTGSCLNQQITPLIDWALAQGRKRFALIGSDYVYPRTANKLIRSLLAGSDSEVVWDSYHGLDCDSFRDTLEQMQERKPDIVINTVNGTGNIALLSSMTEYPGLAGPDMVCSLSCSETMYGVLGEKGTGQLSIWGYFQSLPSSGNQVFLDKFRNVTGKDRMASDPIATAYSQVLLWAGAVEKVGSFEARDLMGHLAGVAVECPLGRLEIQPNNHVKRHAHMARMESDGLFKAFWSSPEPIDPLPWLGIEETDIPSKALLRDLLGKVPDDLEMQARLQSEVKQRQQAEKFLKKSQRLLHQSERIAMIGGFERNLRTGVGYWTDNMYRLLGHEPHSIAAGVDSFSKFIVPEDRDRFIKDFYQGLKSRERFRHEYRLLTKQGEVRNVLIQADMVSKEDEDDESYFGTMMDITARKLNEKELRLYSERLALASRAGGIGVWEWNINDDTLVWDDMMYAIYQVRPDEFPCTLSAWMSLIHPDDLQAMNATLREAAQTSSSWDLSFRIVRPGGQVRYIKCAALSQLTGGVELGHMIGVNMDVTEDHEKEERLFLLANTDELTGILSRRRLLELMTQELVRVSRYPAPFSMIMFDLDRFKQVNDTYGHSTGDQVLKNTTRAVASLLREVDIFGRLGGEEFAIGLPSTPLEGARAIAERLCEIIQQTEVKLEDGRGIHVTASFGVAENTPHCKDVEDMLKLADIALYQAKQLGRNRVEVMVASSYKARPEVLQG